MAMPGDEFYQEAFRELSTCRDVGMGLGEIPWTAIIEYAEKERLDDDGTLLLRKVMRGMDTAYLKWHADEAEKERKRRERESKQRSQQGGGHRVRRRG